MKAAGIIEALTSAIPKEDSWSRNEPYGAYGVDPKATVERVLFCVTPTPDVVDTFLNEGYDLLVSHHPFIVPVPQIILHTAMDCCAGGLNDQWAIALGIHGAQHFDKNLGWYGNIEPQSIEQLMEKCRDFMGGDPIGSVYTELETISSVVVCSGLGGMVHSRALKTDADCYILGEATTNPMNSPFRAMIECGHTLSEYAPGLKLVRSILEPWVPVDGLGADTDSPDRFGDEVYDG